MKLGRLSFHTFTSNVALVNFCQLHLKNVYLLRKTYKPCAKHTFIEMEQYSKILQCFTGFRHIASSNTKKPVFI